VHFVLLSGDQTLWKTPANDYDHDDAHVLEHDNREEAFAHRKS
jgi:hypothetical protein